MQRFPVYIFFPFSCKDTNFYSEWEREREHQWKNSNLIALGPEAEQLWPFLTTWTSPTVKLVHTEEAAQSLAKTFLKYDVQGKPAALLEEAIVCTRPNVMNLKNKLFWIKLCLSWEVTEPKAEALCPDVSLIYNIEIITMVFICDYHPTISNQKCHCPAAWNDGSLGGGGKAGKGQKYNIKITYLSICLSEIGSLYFWQTCTESCIKYES